MHIQPINIRDHCWALGKALFPGRAFSHLIWLRRETMIYPDCNKYQYILYLNVTSLPICFWQHHHLQTDIRMPYSPSWNPAQHCSWPRNIFYRQEVGKWIHKSVLSWTSSLRGGLTDRTLEWTIIDSVMILVRWQYLPGWCTATRCSICSELPVHIWCHFPTAITLQYENQEAGGVSFTINSNDPFTKILLPLLQIWVLLT